MANLRDDHRDRNLIVATARNDDVRVPLAGLDELEVHRLHRGQILIENLLERAIALDQIAPESSDQPNVGVRVDENLHVEQVPDSGVEK